MAGTAPMSGHNHPAGWAAFRVLRQRSAPLPRLVHGNYKHGIRSKAGHEAMRRVRLAARVMKMRNRQLLAIPDEVFDAWIPSYPEPVGWRGYWRHAGGRTRVGG